MKYKIDWVEVDKYGNQKVSVTGEDGNKILQAELGKEYKGQSIMAGHDIQAKLWISPKNGKVYLFMEKAQGEGETPLKSPRSPSQTHPAIEYQKEITKNVAKTLDRKEDSYQVSGTARDATLIAISMKGQQDWTREDMKAEVEYWRQYLWLNYWKENKDFPPFND